MSVQATPERGYVYVIANDANSLVKIGWAKHPETRCDYLQTGSPAILEVVREYPGDRTLESWLHRYFAVQRKHGEWFNLGKRLHLIGAAIGEYNRQVAEKIAAEKRNKDHESWERRSAAISAGIARRKARGEPVGAATRRPLTSG